MTEPDVVLTDYGLAVESGVFAWLMQRKASLAQPLGRWFFVFFGATSVAALVGGTVHGFFLDPTTLEARLLWPVALLGVGGAALAGWGIGAYVEFAPEKARWISTAATLWFAVYAGVVVVALPTFAVAVANYLPPTIFLLLVMARAGARQRDPVLLLGAAGTLLTVVATGLQQTEVGLHPRYFDHNALYHVIQAVSLALIFASARRLTGRRRC